MELNTVTLTQINNSAPTRPDNAARMAQTARDGALSLASQAVHQKLGGVLTGLKTAGHLDENLKSNNAQPSQLVQAANIKGGRLLDPSNRIDVANFADYRAERLRLQDTLAAAARDDAAQEAAQQEAAARENSIQDEITLDEVHQDISSKQMKQDNAARDTKNSDAVSSTETTSPSPDVSAYQSSSTETTTISYEA